MTIKYGDRGYRYVLLEAGHLAQNALLTCNALKLAAVPVGGFIDDEVKEIMGHGSSNHLPVYLLIIGAIEKRNRRPV